MKNHLRSTIILTLLSVFETTKAAVPAQSFYRRPESLFPSGQASLSDLNKKKLREFHEFNYLIEKDGVALKLPTQLILRDMDLSLKLAHSSTGETGLVVGTRGPWAMVVSGAKNRKTWWPVGQGLPVPDDQGLAIPLTRTSLRKEPQWKTETLSFLEAGTRLRLLQVKEDWAEVSLLLKPSEKGWVDLSAVVLKHDFASFILPKGGSWTPVRYRQGRFMITGRGEKVPVEQVQSLMTRPDLGILTEDLKARGLFQRSFVQIKNWESLKWVVSQLPGHGEVFWRDDQSTGAPTATSGRTATFSFEEILKKPIFSVAFHPLNPRIGLISAEGIYMTTDGLNWRSLPAFGKDNLAVAISADFELFVGHSRSTDQGKTFQPFLKWEQIAELMEGKSRKAPKILRLVSITPLAQKKIAIEVDTGVKVAKLVGSGQFGLVTHWKDQ